MGKGRRNNRNSQMVVARPKTDIVPQKTATSRPPKSLQDTVSIEPPPQSAPAQQIQSFLSNLLVLGFALAEPIISGGFAGPGQNGCGKVVTDSCKDTTETDAVRPKGQDAGAALRIQCKSCNAMIGVFLGDGENEILKRHDEQSPFCSRNAKQNSETTELEKNHTEDKDGDTNEEQNAKKEEEPIVGASKRKTVSISSLEENVICDSGTEETEDRKSTSPNVDEEGAVGGQEPGASSTPSVPTRRIARPWDPRNAKYPQFIEKPERLHSLSSWDKRGYCLGDIADAGLLQLEGITDKLICFFCGVTVPCLQKHDDAYIEHAIRSPDCDYVRHKKGQDYLNVIIDIYLDGDMEAVDKAINAVAAIKAPDIRNGTIGNYFSATSINSGATGISRSATGSNYGAIGSDYGTSSSGPTTMNKVNSTLPPNYRPGLRGGAQDSVQNLQTYVTSSENTTNTNAGPVSSAQRSSNISQTQTSSQNTNSPSFTILKTNVSKPKPVKQPRIAKRQVQAREVRARLDTEGAQRIISMGYSAQLVGAVIAEQLIYNGDDFKSFTEMMMAVIDAAEMGDAFPANHYDLGLNSNTSKSLPPMSKSEPAPRPPSPAKSLPAPERVPSPNSTAELRSLEIENEKLKETQTCTVCMDLERDVLFVPCGHLVVCHKCSPRLNCCPVCRRGIKGIVKVFLS